MGNEDAEHLVVVVFITFDVEGCASTVNCKNGHGFVVVQVTPGYLLHFFSWVVLWGDKSCAMTSALEVLVYT